MLDPSATVGQSYTFTTVADLGGIDAITYTKTITVTDAVAEMVRLLFWPRLRSYILAPKTNQHAMPEANE